MVFPRWIGIDIGSYSIKIVEIAKGQGGRFKLLNSIVIPSPSLEDGGEALGARLLKTLEENKISLPMSNLGITSKESIIRYTRIPPVPPWRLKIIMEYEINEMASKTGTEITADYYTLEHASSSSGEQLVLVGMVKNDLLQNKIHGLELAGIHVQKVIPSCIGLYNAYRWLGDWEEDENILVFDIGHENTDMVLLSEGELLFARSLSIGSKAFSKSLASTLGITEDEGEKIKREEGGLLSSSTDPDVYRGLVEGAEQFGSILHTAIGFAKSQLKQSNLEIHKIYLTGGGSKLRGLDKYLEKLLEIPVEPFEYMEALDTSAIKGRGKETLKESFPELTSSIGLALSESPRSISMNLLPHEYQKKFEFRHKTLYMMIAGVVLVVYILLSLIVAVNMRSKAAKTLASVEEERNQTELLLSELRKKKEANQEILRLAKELERRTHGLHYALLLMDFFNQKTPNGVFLKKLDFQSSSLNDQKEPVFEVLLFADNSTLEAPEKIKNLDRLLQNLDFVRTTSLSSGLPTHGNQYELQYRVKIFCK
ncbi:MAG: hypothetical protein D6785_00935 [Planctomycetota bacterium]|nr:MAG: hypothetical protein D6785_00935 [Planctomycetota bacterium]